MSSLIPTGREEVTTPAEVPVPAILHCPYCGKRHFDVDEWKERPHHTHLCLYCQKMWRVAPYCYGAALLGEGQSCAAGLEEARVLNAKIEEERLRGVIRPGCREHLHPIGRSGLRPAWARTRESFARVIPAGGDLL